MQPQERDVALLWDMLQAAEDISQFIQGVSYREFNSNKVLRYAVERQILVIGEAANKVSPALKAANPQIPWNAIIGQRNVIAHEYGEIFVERIWRVASERIPELIMLLKPLVPEPPNQNT